MKTPPTDQPVAAGPSKKWLDAHQEVLRQAVTQTPPVAASFEKPAIVSADAWLTARLELLRAEKEFTRQRDALSARQRALPWLKLSKDYQFDSPRGPVSLADLFGAQRQLIVQHFMFGPNWEEGCKSCSFMLDHIAPTIPHLRARDVAFAAISHAPVAEILPFKERMGWDVNWVSSYESDFNSDFHVSFPPEKVEHEKVYYNFSEQDVPNSELPGLSVFVKDTSGTIYHTYSTYGRGVELVMTTYDLLDIVPKGRDEAKLDYGMMWLRYHDRYEMTATT